MVVVVLFFGAMTGGAQPAGKDGDAAPVGWRIMNTLETHVRSLPADTMTLLTGVRVTGVQLAPDNQ